MEFKKKKQFSLVQDGSKRPHVLLKKRFCHLIVQLKQGAKGGVLVVLNSGLTLSDCLAITIPECWYHKMYLWFTETYGTNILSWAEASKITFWVRVFLSYPTTEVSDLCVCAVVWVQAVSVRLRLYLARLLCGGGGTGSAARRDGSPLAARGPCGAPNKRGYSTFAGRRTDIYFHNKRFGKISQWGSNLLLWLLNACFKSNKSHEVGQRPLYLIRQNTHFLCSHFVYHR